MRLLMSMQELRCEVLPIAHLIRAQAQEAAIDAMLKELEQMQQSTREVTAKVNEARLRQRVVAEVLHFVLLVYAHVRIAATLWASIASAIDDRMRAR